MPHQRTAYGRCAAGHNPNGGCRTSSAQSLDSQGMVARGWRARGANRRLAPGRLRPVVWPRDAQARVPAAPGDGHQRCRRCRSSALRDAGPAARPARHERGYDSRRAEEEGPGFGCERRGRAVPSCRVGEARGRPRRCPCPGGGTYAEAGEDSPRKAVVRVQAALQQKLTAELASMPKLSVVAAHAGSPPTSSRPS